MSRQVNRQTKSSPEVPDSLVKALRRMILAVEWFRAAYPLKENHERIDCSTSNWRR